jgi:hypothetical protein
VSPNEVATTGLGDNEEDDERAVSSGGFPQRPNTDIFSGGGIFGNLFGQPQRPTYAPQYQYPSGQYPSGQNPGAGGRPQYPGTGQYGDLRRNYDDRGWFPPSRIDPDVPSWLRRDHQRGE